MNTAAFSPGELVFYPGRSLPAIASSRRELAGLLLRGQPPRMAAGRLPQLYALCGQSHRITASLAIDCALGLRAAATADEAASLRLETAREHVRRIWLDWPHWLGGVDGAPHMRHLLACPWLQPAQSGDALAWLEAAVLRMPAGGWLACWQRDAAGWLGDWAAQAASLPAQLLRTVECDAAQLPAGAPALLEHGDAAALRRWGRRWPAGRILRRRPAAMARCARRGCPAAWRMASHFAVPGCAWARASRNWPGWRWRGMMAARRRWRWGPWTWGRAARWPGAKWRAACCCTGCGWSSAMAGR